VNLTQVKQDVLRHVWNFHSLSRNTEVTWQQKHISVIECKVDPTECQFAKIKSCFVTRWLYYTNCGDHYLFCKFPVQPWSEETILQLQHSIRVTFMAYISHFCV